MIKTLLVNPPFTLRERYGKCIKSFGAVTEPMGLAYLAGMLEANGFPVQILDAPALGVGSKEIVERIRESGVNLVGVTLLTPMFNAVKDLTEHIKMECPDVKIIVGGPHPTALPERTLEQMPHIDYVCVGEGEHTILELVRSFECEDLSGIRGLAYREDGVIVVSPPRPCDMNLDDLPKPARQMLPIKKYTLTASRTRGSGFCPTIIIARGCPYDCQYCSHPFGRSFRHHSVDRVIEELKELKRDYAVEQVNFEADTLTIDKHFIIDLCSRLVDEDLNIRWTCESRVDTVDTQMLEAMKAAGCWQISYGVESGSQRLIDEIQKRVTKEKATETFALTKKAGITIRAFFMLGLPSETRSESLMTIEFAKELDPLWAQFTVTIPYPGTPMFERLSEQEQIIHYDWGDYNTWGGWADKRLPYVPKGRTEEEIKELQKKAMRMFYLRPKVAFRFMRDVSSISDFKKLATGLFLLVRTKLTANRVSPD